jgi:Family of unknown function (DUF6283)
MNEIRAKACSACPYRRDVPSGVWDWAEYEKLRLFDEETFAQPFRGFACHATPEYFCHGWALVHTSRPHQFDLLALRVRPCEIPEPSTEFFGSGNEAADHGQADAEAPGENAVRTIDKLKRQHARIRHG